MTKPGRCTFVWLLPLRYAANSSRSRGTSGSINRGIRFITEYKLAEPIGMPTPCVIFNIHPSYFLVRI
jgi:hypothetical protein